MKENNIGSSDIWSDDIEDEYSLLSSQQVVLCRGKPLQQHIPSSDALASTFHDFSRLFTTLDALASTFHDFGCPRIDFPRLFTTLDALALAFHDLSRHCHPRHSKYGLSFFFDASWYPCGMMGALVKPYSHVVECFCQMIFVRKLRKFSKDYKPYSFLKGDNSKKRPSTLNSLG